MLNRSLESDATGIYGTKLPYGGCGGEWVLISTIELVTVTGSMRPTSNITPISSPVPTLNISNSYLVFPTIKIFYIFGIHPIFTCKLPKSSFQYKHI